MLFTRRWWLIARNRAARSTAQGFILALGPSTFGWMQLNWTYVAYATFGAGVVSLANSIIRSPVSKEERE